MILYPMFALLGATQAMLVPCPPGPYDVAVKHFELTDEFRIDTFAPKPNTLRRFMVSAYIPIEAKYGCKSEIVPYMPPATAKAYGPVAEELGLPKGFIDKFEMEFCNISTINPKKYHEKKEYPIAIFSPGYQGTRFAYGAMARSLSSHGYIILTVDHPYEAPLVEFPDGTAAKGVKFPDNMNTTLRQLEARTQDEVWLIWQMVNDTIIDSVFKGFPGTFDIEKAVAYGHSFGGSTAASTALVDPRVIGGLNLDGPIYGAPKEKGTKYASFVQVGAKGSDHQGWSEFYKKIDGESMELLVKDARHYAFTDVPLLLAKSKVQAKAQPKIDEIFGTLPGRKIERVVNDIMIAFMDLVMTKNPDQLKKIGKEADIKVVRSDL